MSSPPHDIFIARTSIDWSSAPAPHISPLSPSELSAYLTRIGLSSTSSDFLKCSESSLREIVRAHALSIPFENYDVTLGKYISMDKTDIFKKLVVEERGGYCLETNLLLRSALLSLGFEVRIRAARVWMRIAPVYTPMDPPLPRLHIALLVRTPPGGVGGDTEKLSENQYNNDQTEWLVDCGFGGGGPSDPIPFRTGVEISSGGDLFRLDAGSVELGEDSIVFLGVRQGVWERLYSFEHSNWDSPIVHVSDFLLVSHFVQTAQGTLFFKMRVATKPLPDGRLTLLNNELRRRGIEQLGKVPTLEVSSIGNAEELRRVAKDNFNIKLTVEEAEKIFNANQG